MATIRKRKKVSWAPDGNLCQIRHFMSEDRPSRVGLVIDHIMQFKPSQRLQLISSKKQQPKLCITNLLNSAKSISVPTIRWKCAVKIKLDPSWLVACGEKSTEVDKQKQREMKVLEAVFLPIDIPHSPFGAFCKDEYLPDDCNTPIIRITPVEDDVAPSDLPSGLVTLPSGAYPQIPVVSACQPSGFLNSAHRVDAEQTLNFGVNQGVNTCCAEADVAAAASAALTLLLKGSETGSGINAYILMKILNNPDIVSMLHNTPLFASANPSLIPNPASGECRGDAKTTLSASTTLQPRQLDSMLNSEAAMLAPSNTGGLGMVHSLIASVANGSQLNKPLPASIKPSPIPSPASGECGGDAKTTLSASTTLQPRQSMPYSEAAMLAPSNTRGLGMVHSLIPSVANGSQLNKPLPASIKPSPIPNPASGECGGDGKTTLSASTTLQPRHHYSIPNAKAATLAPSSTRGLEMVRSLIPSVANGSRLNKPLPAKAKSCPITNPASGQCGGDPKTTPRVSTTLQPRHCVSMPNAEAATLTPSSTSGLGIHSLIPSLANGFQVNKTNKAPPQTTTNQVKPQFNSPLNNKKRPPPVVKDADYYKNLIKKHGLDKDASYFKNLIKKHGLDKHKQNVQGKLPHPLQSLHTKKSGKLGRNFKSCVYFNTPRGCKKGSECPFQHDTTSIQAGNPNAKRTKIIRELTSKS